MPISKYPRYGQKLAPLRLHEILDVPIPKLHYGIRSSKFEKFKELDATVWKFLEPDTCQALSEGVVKLVASSISHLPPRISKRNIPVPMHNFTISNLELEQRTYNCLQEWGFCRDPESLRSITIKDILRIRGFGAKSLVDLLTSLESITYESPRPVDNKQEVITALINEAMKLRKMRTSDKLDRTDPRFGNFIRSLNFKGDTLKEITENIVSADFTGTDPSILLDKLKNLSREIRKVSGIYIEEELMQLIASVWGGRQRFSNRNTLLVACQFGWDGGGGATLKVAGERFGITRERTRQICKSVKDHLKNRNTFTPVLNKAMKIVEKRVPDSVGKIENALKEKGISRENFRLEGLINAADILGKEIIFQQETIYSNTHIIPNGSLTYSKGIVGITLKLISRWGATTIAELRAVVKEEMGGRVYEKFLLGLLCGRDDFKWLDKAQGWFWLKSKTKNTLTGNLRKMFSVSHSLSLSEIRKGIARTQRMGGYAPPQRVLKALCCDLPGYKIEDNSVISKQKLDFRKILSKSETIMVEVLQEHGPLLYISDFREYCLAKDMHRDTFQLYLSWTPVLARFAQGVYGLRGTKVSPGLAESYMPKHRVTTIKDYGWTSDGMIWCGYKITHDMVRRGACNIPVAMKRYISGKFKIVTDEGTFMGDLTIREYGVLGLGAFFKRRGGEPGDYLIIKFNLGEELSIVLLGDESLIEEFS